MPESSILQIGVYQLRNLVQQKVLFQMLDLRHGKSLLESSELLKNAIKVSGQDVLEHVRKTGLAVHDHIVLICEDGTESLLRAQALENQGYINVFVLDGGVRTLVDN